MYEEKDIWERVPNNIYEPSPKILESYRKQAYTNGLRYFRLKL